MHLRPLTKLEILKLLNSNRRLVPSTKKMDEKVTKKKLAYQMDSSKLEKFFWCEITSLLLERGMPTMLKAQRASNAVLVEAVARGGAGLRRQKRNLWPLLRGPKGLPAGPTLLVTIIYTAQLFSHRSVAQTQNYTKNQTLEKNIYKFERRVYKSIIVSMATRFDVTAGESLGKNGQKRAAARCLGVY